MVLPVNLILRRAGLLEGGNLISLVKVVGGIATAIYIVSMVLYPWVDGKWSWFHVQAVWDRWQALNVGILAFLSSLVAFYIAGYNADRQRERNFIAARAFLPSALSELMPYFKASARVFKNSWDTDGQGVADGATPKLPEAYKSIFADCIRYASPEVGDYLSKILVCLQVHDARLRGLLHPDKEIDVLVVGKDSLLTYLYRLGELQALANLLFDFARGESDFKNPRLEWEDFRNAYGNLNLWTSQFFVDEKMNLKAFTERQIAKQ
jgi:hypothetical protein